MEEMKPERHKVKQWLRNMDRKQYETLLETALFTADELKYIHMRCVEGLSFKQIAIQCDLSKSNMCRIAKRISEKMNKAIEGL